MAASATDKFRKGVANWTGAIGAAGVADGTVTTIPLSSSTNLPTDTGVMITINRVDANSKVTGNTEGVVGVVSGSNVASCVRGVEGTAQAWAAGTVVEILHTADNWNDLVDGLLVDHLQTGRHKMTSPQVVTGINDANGNEVIKTPATTSAVNEITVTNAATGNGPTISATGDDTNIDLKMIGKGTGEAKIYNYDDSTYYSAGEFLNTSLYRQALINGNFDVWQRGTSFTTTPFAATIFSADRWRGGGAGVDGGTNPTITMSRQLITSGAILGSYFHHRVNVDGAGSGYGVNSIQQITQRIENGTRNLCGDGKSVTVSFYAKSDIANKRLGVALAQTYGTTGSPSATENIITREPITLTSTWTKYTATFATNTLTSKTFGTDNNDYLELKFLYQWGTTAGNTNVYPSVSAESFVGAGNIDIAQVQLCAGDVALPFMPKSFEEEKRACERYCYVPESSNTSAPIGFGTGVTTTRVDVFVPLPTTMRIAPTLTATAGDWQVSDIVNAPVDVTGISQPANTQSANRVRIQCDVASGITQYRPYQLNADGNANRLLILSAEL
jgi:hypothetical protein